MKVFAIRHKPTGKWMPSRMGRYGRGWSHWNPGLPTDDPPHDANPRIFFTLQSVRNALTMWLQGTWRTTQTQGTYFEPPEDDGPAPFDPPVPRAREEMEIVCLGLEELHVV